VILYGIEEREEERAYWELRVAEYRDANPYYHAWLGDQAAQGDDWQGALRHYQRAVTLLPDDSRLLYATGMIHYRLDELDAASAYLQSAIERAKLRSDIEEYQLQLDALQREQVAGL
jgi:Flp pilus assembly protein TadD